MHYVIGDVHGCYDEMMQLIHKIERKIGYQGDYCIKKPPSRVAFM